VIGRSQHYRTQAVRKALRKPTNPQGFDPGLTGGHCCFRSDGKVKLWNPAAEVCSAGARRVLGKFFPDDEEHGGAERCVSVCLGASPLRMLKPAAAERMARQLT